MPVQESEVEAANEIDGFYASGITASVPDGNSLHASYDISGFNPPTCSDSGIHNQEWTVIFNHIEGPI